MASDEIFSAIEYLIVNETNYKKVKHSGQESPEPEYGVWQGLQKDKPLFGNWQGM